VRQLQQETLSCLLLMLPSTLALLLLVVARLPLSQAQQLALELPVLQ
jgi:hypothetical protein